MWSPILMVLWVLAVAVAVRVRRRRRAGDLLRRSGRGRVTMIRLPADVAVLEVEFLRTCAAWYLS